MSQRCLLSLSLALVLLFGVSTKVQSPSALKIDVDAKLTDGFLQDDQSRLGSLAYHEVIGLMTKAARGENFGYYESTVTNRAKKAGGDNKAELSRMLIELRNLSLRVTKLQEQQAATQKQ